MSQIQLEESSSRRPRYFDGELKHLRIWNSIRDETEILNNKDNISLKPADDINLLLNIPMNSTDTNIYKQELIPNSSSYNIDVTNEMRSYRLIDLLDKTRRAELYSQHDITTTHNNTKQPSHEIGEFTKSFTRMKTLLN